MTRAMVERGTTHHIQRAPRSVHAITLTERESGDLRAECARRASARRHAELDSQELLTAAELAGSRLPERLLGELSRFRTHSNDQGGLIIHNLPIDPVLPPTPADGYASTWQALPVATFVQMAVSSRLGDTISYADEKDGRLIQDIVPIVGTQQRQENSGTVFLELHTEDGFHPYKPDFVTLLCLRPDHDQIARTLLGSVRRVLPLLSESCLATLREPLFPIRISSSFGRSGSVRWSPGLPVLSAGDTEVVLDLHAMEPLGERAGQALAELKAALLPALADAVLDRGDLLVVDNRTAVHGRTGFSARYDGTDRWLRRCFAVADLRRSLPLRHGDSRVCAPLIELAHWPTHRAERRALSGAER